MISVNYIEEINESNELPSFFNLEELHLNKTRIYQLNIKIDSMFQKLQLRLLNLLSN